MIRCVVRPSYSRPTKNRTHASEGSLVSPAMMRRMPPMYFNSSAALTTDSMSKVSLDSF